MKNLLGKIFDKTFLRYNIIGFISAALGYAVMFGMRNFIDWNAVLGAGSSAPYWITSAADYTVSGILSYTLNRKYTFKDRRPIYKSVFKFAACFLISYFTAYSIAKPLTLSIMSHASASNPMLATRNDNIAQFVGLVIFVCINYLLQRFVSFKTKTKC